MTDRSTSHSTFVIERSFAAAPSRVFKAWSDADAKKRWCACDDAMVSEEYSLDFRTGGREVNRVITPAGVVHLFQGYYLDIVDNRRIIYAFDMHVGKKRISASLATVEFEAQVEVQGAGTKLVFTEQIVFLDGYQDRAERIRGTEVGLDNLVASLRGQS